MSGETVRNELSHSTKSVSESASQKYGIDSYDHLSRLLDTTKGEEGMFSLYKNRHTQDLLNIANLFRATEVKAVQQLDRKMKNISSKNKRTGALYGDRGVGKSTLAAALSLSNLISGKIDHVTFFRYKRGESEGQKDDFEEIFSEGKEGAKRGVVFFDDLGYAEQDVAEGKAVPLATSAKNMIAQFESSSTGLLFYISDSGSANTMVNGLYCKVLELVGRSDLSHRLPQTKESDEITLKRDELFGKSYSILNGDVQIFNFAELYGEAIKEETGLLATNPRILRLIIKRLENERGKLDGSLYNDRAFAKDMVKGNALDADGVRVHFNKRASESIESYYSMLEIIARKTDKSTEKAAEAFLTLSYMMESAPELGDIRTKWSALLKEIARKKLMKEIGKKSNYTLDFVLKNAKAEVKIPEHKYVNIYQDKNLVPFGIKYSITITGNMSDMWLQHQKIGENFIAVVDQLRFAIVDGKSTTGLVTARESFPISLSYSGWKETEEIIRDSLNSINGEKDEAIELLERIKTKHIGFLSNEEIQFVQLISEKRQSALEQSRVYTDVKSSMLELTETKKEMFTKPENVHLDIREVLGRFTQGRAEKNLPIY